MKKGILISGIGAMAIVAGALYIGDGDGREYYQPRPMERSEDGANGAMEWQMRRQANQLTGKIDPADVLAARQQTEVIKSKTQATVNWGQLGPTNIGGRTRAFLIDKNNPNIMYSGSVSGGLFRSTTSGSSWQPLDDFESNLAVVSICQASDGTIYYGTGEGVYYGNYGSGSGGILGGGIFKSTDGINFDVIPTTVPSVNALGVDFASVAKIAADPNNPQRLYAATNNGLIVTDDAFANWTRAFSGNFGTVTASDLVVTPSGKVWVKQGAHLFKSDNGDPGTYTQITQTSTNPDFLGSSSRIRMAIAPQDENYVYAIATTPNNSTGATFRDAWQSKDGGVTWRKIGSASVQLNPHRDQGTYNNALSVSPIDKERILVGGVELWEWSESNGWLMIASTAGGEANPFYVHADNHDVVFGPNNPMNIYVVNDGGIFRSTNGGMTWTWLVRDYVTTQYYNIAVGAAEEIMGGTQDNGTILIDPSAPLPKRGVRTPGISFRGNTVDGDGGYAEMSKLDPEIMFKAMQYGIIGRSVDGGETFSFVLSNDVDPARNAGARDFADFVTPFNLWEKLDDPLSIDSITFVADSSFLSVGFGNGKQAFTGTVPRPQAAAEFIPEGLVIRAGNAEIRSDANGNLSGDGSGTFNASSGAFSVSFQNPVNLEITVKAAVRYPAGSTLTLKSATNEIPVVVESLSSALEPLESITVQDPVQSMFAVGVTAFAAGAAANDKNEIGGIWMTRNALSGKFVTPTWYHIATLGNGVTPTTMTFSPDGDALWVGTNTGILYRISNLSAARDSANTSINDYYVAGSVARSQTSVVVKKLVKAFGGRAITDVAIHPDNPDLVVVTLGNYGNNDYLYFSTNGTAANPDLVAKPNNLPKMPLYTATFNYKSGNPYEVYVGSDMGVFATDNINAGMSNWRAENSGMANVPVFDLVQQRTVRYDLKDENDFEGFLYAGTHGRGIYMSNSLSGNVVSTPENVIAENEVENSMINFYPNPARNMANFDLALSGATDVNIVIRSISGKTVKSINFKRLTPETKSLSLDVSALRSGTYIVSVQEGARVKTGKLIITR